MTDQVTQFQGVILAAGFGTRLRPLTNHLPKPLIPFANTTPLALAYTRLRKAGISSVACNAHYLADRVVAAAATLEPGVSVHVSVESPNILGTAGFFGPLSKWLMAKDVILYNSDIISDISIAALCDEHRSSKAAATMVLLSAQADGKTPVFVDADGWITGIGAVDAPWFKGNPDTLRRLSFTGVHAVSERVIAEIPKSGPSEIVPIYREFIRRGRLIRAMVHGGAWFDMGDPDSLFGAYEDILFSRNPALAHLRQECISPAFPKPTRPNRGLWMRRDESTQWEGRRIGERTWVSCPEDLPERVELTRTIALPGARFSLGERAASEIRGFGEIVMVRT